VAVRRAEPDEYQKRLGAIRLSLDDLQEVINLMTERCEAVSIACRRSRYGKDSVFIDRAFDLAVLRSSESRYVEIVGRTGTGRLSLTLGFGCAQLGINARGENLDSLVAVAHRLESLLQSSAVARAKRFAPVLAALGLTSVLVVYAVHGFTYNRYAGRSLFAPPGPDRYPALAVSIAATSALVFLFFSVVSTWDYLAEGTAIVQRRTVFDARADKRQLTSGFLLTVMGALIAAAIGIGLAVAGIRH
jgi:hypothetical protein